MTNNDRPPDADVNELTAKLNEGLKTCRSMVQNYRAMLRNGQSADPVESPDRSDTYPDSPETA
jgi:hypothetical protein